ncbi:MAG TPA: alpha/beta hydrolase [Solirubrobacteraceae bacterium]
MPPSLPRIAVDALRAGEAHRYAAHQWAQAELHLPASAGPHPVAVVLHGGSWRMTYGKRVMRPVCRDLVRHGWAAWNVEYRRVGGNEGGGWPGTYDDVAASIDHLASVEAPLDLARVAFVGHSAGGSLALWAAGRPQLPAGAPGAGTPRVVPALVIAQAPVANLERGRALTAPGGIVNALLGGTPEEVPERYAAANPQRRAGLPTPMLLVHGQDDRTLTVRQSVEYVEAADAAGGPARLAALPHAAHRDHVDPRSPAWQVVLERLARA